MKEKLIEIKMTKTTLFIPETELINLLAKDPQLWKQAIRRGKAIKRVQAADKRRGLTKIGELLPEALEDIERRRNS